MAVTVTCIVPTVGRETLQAALDSCADADEVLVVVDRAKAGDWQPERLAANVRVLEVPQCDRGGHSSRNHAMPYATSTHLCFLDDDDVYLPGAIDLMRVHATDRPVIFRMEHPEHGIIWRDPSLWFGNVSTQMFLVPNDPARLGVWEHHQPELPQPGGDYSFITSTVAKMGEPVWREELIAKYRPTLPSIGVVTPWLDHHDLIPDYVEAVSGLWPRDELIVVDNGSNPALTLPGIRLEENRGFSAASNLGMETAATDAVLFLNNDIAATRPGWLNKLRHALEPGVLVGAKLRDDHHTTVDGQPIPYLDGWCLAGMRDDLLELGGFDETLEEPAYYSDNLLCLEARAAGMSLKEVDLGLVHKTSTTSQPHLNPRVAEATIANRRRYETYARELLTAA